MRRARHAIRGRLRPVRRRPRPETLAEAGVRPSETVDSDARQLAPRRPWTRRGAGPRLAVASASCPTCAAAPGESRRPSLRLRPPMAESKELLTVAEIAASLKMGHASVEIIVGARAAPGALDRNFGAARSTPRPAPIGDDVLRRRLAAALRQLAHGPQSAAPCDRNRVTALSLSRINPTKFRTNDIGACVKIPAGRADRPPA